MTIQKKLPYINPATGEQFGEVYITPSEMVQAAQREMNRMFPVWSGKPVKERIRILRQFQRVLIDAADEITAVINQDCGKSRQDALFEVFVTVDSLNHYCRKAPDWLAREPVQRGLAAFFKRVYVEHRPRGVVAVISPWNYPFTLALTPVLTALLAGNTVLLKPSEITAATGKLIEDLFARVPELAPFVRVLHGDGTTGAALVESAPDYIFMTGSVPTARKIQEAAAKTLTPAGFELGGKDATIVLEDANLADAARWSVWGACFNAGQTCMGVERVYVVEPVYDEFVQLAVAEAQAIKVGYNDHMDDLHHYGPITMPRQMEIIEEHLRDALAKGARVLTGGRRNGMFFEPTVLVDVEHHMKVMSEETFGPILPVMKVKDEAEAIMLANDCEFGLGGSVWSSDVARAERVAKQVQAASMLINDVLVQFAIPALPFGGVKRSGTGRTHGKAGLLGFTFPYAYAVSKGPHPLDLGTTLRLPGNYRITRALLHLAFGTSPQQRVKPVIKAVQQTASRSPARAAASAGLAGLAAAFVFGWLWWARK